MEKKKVAGYARIGKDGVFTGWIGTQRQLIEETMEKHPEWELVDIYCDEGVSGRAKRMFGFEQMLGDAEKNKFDIILVKKIEVLSRDMEQARNKINRLNELGIEVFFIADNVSSHDDKFKEMLNIMSIIDEKEQELMRIRKRPKTT